MAQRRSLQVLAVSAIAVLGAIGLLVHPVHEAVGHAASGDTTALRQQLRGTGVAGVLLLYALMMLHIVLLFPAEIINMVAGFTYGIPIAMAICVSGWFVSAMGTYALGRIAGRPLVAKLAGAERLASAEALMERGGVARAAAPAAAADRARSAAWATWRAPRACRSGASPGRARSARSR